MGCRIRSGGWCIEGVVCCMEALPCGNAKMVPVCEEHPLTECKHFLACHQLEQELGFDCGDSIESFYGRLGVVLIGTVMDGDCGIDLACMMLGLPQTAETRAVLRQEISDYLCERHDKPWMHQLLVACSELNIEDLEEFRSCGGSSVVLELDPPVAKPVEEVRSGGGSAVGEECDITNLQNLTPKMHQNF